MNKRTVFVGLSGGVDSSVSAALLKEAGYEVVGVFIRTWHPDFLECNEAQERRDAMRVAAHLDIPFLTFNFEDIYKKEVALYMISEYKKGRTPNPDVMCNKEVKFGAFLKKAISMGADFIATGHYAQIKNKNLLKGSDPSKDQSYFLWTLKQKQLNKVLFPIGYFKKTKVRRLAKKFKLPVAEKKDSQGICFLGKVDLKDFLKHFIKGKKGEIRNQEGEVIGHHSGSVFYTLGERHGFTITKKGSSDGRYYIVGKDIKKNILYVSNKKMSLNKGTCISLLENRSRLGASVSVAPYKEIFSIRLDSINWINEVPQESKDYQAQLCYHGEFLSCKIKVTSKTIAEVFFTKPILVASGQSCVIYNNDICLGGGIVI